MLTHDETLLSSTYERRRGKLKEISGVGIALYHIDPFLINYMFSLTKFYIVMQILKTFNKFRISKLARHVTALVFFNFQVAFTRFLKNQKTKFVAFFFFKIHFHHYKSFSENIAAKTVICCMKSFNLIAANVPLSFKPCHWNAKPNGFLFDKDIYTLQTRLPGGAL